MLKSETKIANIVFNSFINDSRVLKESKSLANQSYKVEVIAHGDEGLPKKEKKDNFIIKRFSYLDRKVTKSKWEKLKMYFQWLKEVVNYTKYFDILHCNDLNTLPVAFIIKRFYNKDIKVIYDSHEFAINEIPNESKVSIKIKYFLEKYLIKYADKVITVSNSIADEYVKLYDIPKPVIVLNTPIYKTIEKKDIFRETFDIKKDQTIFLYQGGLARGRGIEIVLDTFKGIKDDKSVIVFMGYGLLEDEIKQASKKYNNIYFHKAVSPDILLDYTSSADFGISTIEDSCLSYRYCLPNKMFEYLMAEVLVIVSNLPEMKKIVEDSGVGIVAKENTPQGLKDAIKKALKLDKKDLQQNIQNVKEVYNWKEQEKVLLKIYRELSK